MPRPTTNAAPSPGGPKLGDVNAELSAEVAILTERRKELTKTYKAEPKVRISGSPMYQPYFGVTMPIIVNGIAIYVPLDGQPYEVPETFAGIFYKRLQDVDKDISARRQLSDVRNNNEAYAGEKSLISRG